MADNLVFGVKIDLQKGVEEALKDGDKALERIEKALGKHPITIKLRMDNKVARGASTELTGFRKQLAELTHQWNALTAAERGSAAGAAIREKFRALRTEAQGYTSTLQAAVKAEDKMSEAQLRTATSSSKLSLSYNNQTRYLSKLIQRIAMYASFSYVNNFLTSVREVTAEFELQRVSLGAIIQDQTRANQLFSEIKNFALQSPIKILDLTKYTKQLAAYRIETDQLFDTTKRLADISVGLGVSMDRLILAYGQVKATGYLRASEVRQFTEAGLGIVDSLAEKLTRVNGELVRASDVMDMISKREIPFEMVADIFQDMTDKGGMFYDMQVKQGNTLYGMWQKLGDAAAMMYDEIGNTPWVNEGMKGAIQLLRTLMLHWKQVGIVISGVTVYLVANMVATKNAAIATAAATSANQIHVASLQQKLGALRLEQMNLKSTTVVQRLHTAATISATKAQIAAATATNVFSKALYGLKAAFLSNPWGWVILALSTIVGWLSTAESATEKLSNKLGEIDLQYDKKNMYDTQNLKDLADAAVNAADGSNAQKEALDELARTYRDSIPAELLTIENLRRMRGEYGELIPLIEEYNAKQRKSEQDTAVHERFDAEIQRKREEAREMIKESMVGMSDKGLLGEIKVDDRQLQTLFNAIDKYAAITTDKFEVLRKAAQDFYDVLDERQKSLINESMTKLGKTPLDRTVNLLQASTQTLKDTFTNFFGEPFDYKPGFLVDMTQEIIDMNQALKANQDELDKEVAKLNKYSEGVERTAKIIQNQTASGLVLKVMTQFDINDEEKVAELIEQLQKGEISEISKLTIDPNASKELDAFYENMIKLQESIELFNPEKAKETISALTEEWNKAKKELSTPLSLDDLVKFDYSDYDTATQFIMLNNDKVNSIADELRKALKEAGIAVRDEWIHTVEQIDPKDLTNLSAVNIDEIINYVSQQISEGAQDPQLLNALKDYKKNLELLAPTDAISITARDKIMQIAKTTGASVGFISTFLKQSGENWEEYKKRADEQIDKLRNKIAALKGEILDLSNAPSWLAPVANALLALKKDEAEQAKKDLEAAEAASKWIATHVYDDKKSKSRSKGSKGGAKSDPRLQILNEMVQLAEKLNKEYSDWEKKVGSTHALEKVNDTYKETVKYAEQVAKDAGIKLPHLKTPTNAKELNQYLDAVRKVMEAAKGLKGGKKAAIELVVKMSNNVSAEDQKAIEAKIKALADRISRTKTAKEFYDKVLGMTGDVELAANVSLQIYGSTGRELKEQVKEQFTKAFEGLKNDHADIMPKVSEIIDRGAYEELRDYIALLPKDQQKAAEDLVKAQQQMSVKQYEQWLKDLEKAKDYADKRIELSRYTANQIAAIEERIAKLNPQAADYEQQKAMLEKLIAGYKSREGREAAGLEYEQFKNSALYVQVFENLDNASKTALENMRNRLIALKDQWKNLSPEKVKELTKRLEELDAQIAQRNPFKTIADSIKKLREMRNSGRTKEGDAQKAFDAEEERKAAEAKMHADEATYQALVKIVGEESTIAKLARKVADESKEAYRKAEQTADDAAETAREWENITEAIDNANQQIDKYQEQINEALGGIRKMMEAFGASDEDMQFFDDVVGALNEIVDAGQQAATSVGNIMSGNILGGITSGISAIGGLVSGFSNLFHAGKVRKANKEIKRQQELLDQLEYTYGRLQNAADKLFGADYLNNYNQQLKVLQAQQAAYLKQAEAERSKGKKADEEKIKEYENQARETADAIKELQDDLVAQIVGTDVASAARDFANAWLDAYLSFGSTTDAIKEKFDDMIKHMIVESYLAQTVKNALQPIFDMIDERLADGDLSAQDIVDIQREYNKAEDDIDNGLRVRMELLKELGLDVESLRNADSGYTGIAKNIAGATSEEINTAAAIGNTIMYHTSHLPIISQNVAAMYQLMSQGKTAIPDSGSAGWTDWQQQAMANYNAIARNTADTVVECRRAAVACETATEKLNRALRTKGATSGFNVFLNS